MDGYLSYITLFLQRQLEELPALAQPEWKVPLVEYATEIRLLGQGPVS